MWEKLLDKIDNETAKYSPQMVLLMSVLLGLLIMGGVYYFIIADQIETNEKLLNNNNKLINKINKKRRLNRLLPDRIVSYKKNYEKEKKNIEKLKYEKLNLLTNIQSNEYLSFNPKKEATLLQSILDKSVKQNVLIDEISINLANKKFAGLLKTKETLDIKGSGKFLDIEKLIRFIEKQRLFILIDNLEYSFDSSSSLLKFEAQISIYGADL